MAKHNFNKSSKPFYFSVTFKADKLDVNKFARQLGMTPTGLASSPIDGWDFQAGFVRAGTTGEVHLLVNYSECCSYYAVDSYAIVGTARDKDSRNKIKPLFDEAIKAIGQAGGQVDKKLLKKPPRSSSRP
ncbi:MAG: hypothetical protein ACAH83_15490 [Alphaproteobacteria bacterium]